MTKRYALLQLLKHGPLTRSEMVEMTGWGRDQVSNAFDKLRRKKLIRRAVLFNGWVANV